MCPADSATNENYAKTRHLATETTCEGWLVYCEEQSRAKKGELESKEELYYAIL